MTSHPHFLWADLFKKQKPAQKAMAQALTENTLFSTLSPKELTYLTEMLYERVYQPNEIIFQQNDRGIGMYVIREGAVAIQSHTPVGEVLVTTLKEGSFFGEMALIDQDNVRTASAVATERTVLIGFFISDLNEILDRKPSMGVKILFQLADVLAKRLHETTRSLAQASAIHSIHSQNDPKPQGGEHFENAA